LYAISGEDVTPEADLPNIVPETSPNGKFIP